MSCKMMIIFANDGSRYQIIVGSNQHLNRDKILDKLNLSINQIESIDYHLIDQNRRYVIKQHSPLSPVEQNTTFGWVSEASSSNSAIFHANRQCPNCTLSKRIPIDLAIIQNITFCPNCCHFVYIIHITS